MYVRVCVDVIFVIFDLCVCVRLFVCLCVCLFVGVIVWMRVVVYVYFLRSLGLGARYAPTQRRGFVGCYV